MARYMGDPWTLDAVREGLGLAARVHSRQCEVVASTFPTVPDGVKYGAHPERLFWNQVSGLSLMVMKVFAQNCSGIVFP